MNLCHQSILILWTAKNPTAKNPNTNCWMLTVIPRISHWISPLEFISTTQLHLDLCKFKFYASTHLFLHVESGWTPLFLVSKSPGDGCLLVGGAGRCHKGLADLPADGSQEEPSSVKFHQLQIGSDSWWLMMVNMMVNDGSLMVNLCSSIVNNGFPKCSGAFLCTPNGGWWWWTMVKNG